MNRPFIVDTWMSRRNIENLKNFLPTKIPINQINQLEWMQNKCKVMELIVIYVERGI